MDEEDAVYGSGLHSVDLKSVSSHETVEYAARQVQRDVYDTLHQVLSYDTLEVRRGAAYGALGALGASHYSNVEAGTEVSGATGAPAKVRPRHAWTEAAEVASPEYEVDA